VIFSPQHLYHFISGLNLGLYKEDAFSSYCDSNPWNPAGDGLLFEDFKFPIFFINETKLNQSVLLNDVEFK
jgi:hypothetical protein